MNLEQTADRYATLAMQPGWWAYTRDRVQAMEADKEAYGMWDGLRAAVGARIKAAGFRPHPSEEGRWWLFEK